MKSSVDGPLSDPGDSGEGLEEYPKRCPRSLVILDNTPTVLTYVLGTIILLFISFLASAVYVLYCFLSTVAIWRFVCVHCHYYGGVCPCGYSIVASSLFEKGDESLMTSRFKLLVVLVLPSWFAPAVTAILLLLTNFSCVLFSLFLTFIFAAFVLTPLISKRIGCRICEYREDCPWMK